MRCGLKTTRRYPQLGPRMCDEASRDPTGGHDVAFIIIIDIASGGPRCFCGYMWSTYNIADKSVFGVQTVHCTQRNRMDWGEGVEGGSLRMG